LLLKLFLTLACTLQGIALILNYECNGIRYLYFARVNAVILDVTVSKCLYLFEIYYYLGVFFV